MASIDSIKASDGSGNASVATVQTTRAALATTLIVDTVLGINTNFMGSMGTPHSFVDPITSETITVISEATCVDFKGHIDGSNLEIDTIAPGYTDLGSAVGDIIIIKPTTQLGDEVATILEVAHEDDGGLKPTAMEEFYKESELIFDHVASGCVLTGTGYGSTLAWSLTAGVVYINGRRYTVAAATGVVVATKDTYFDLLEPVTGTVATLVYTGGNSVTVNAASPALAANSVRMAIIQSGANIASVAAINQGQEGKLLPITSSTPYMVTDSLGNLICPRDPSRKILGLRQINSTFSLTASETTPTQITGLSCPVIVPTGRKIKVTASGRDAFNATAGNSIQFTLWEGVVNSGTQIQSAFVGPVNTSAASPAFVERVYTPNSASITLNAGIQSGGLTDVTFEAAGTTPGVIRVELV